MKAKFKSMLLGVGVALSVGMLPSSADAHVLDGAKGQLDINGFL